MFFQKLIKKYRREFILYFVFGLIATGADVATLGCLQLKFGLGRILYLIMDYDSLLNLHFWLKQNYVFCAGIAFLMGNIVSYIFSIRIVFVKYKRRQKGLEIMIFISINLVGLLINELIISSFSVAFLPISKALAIVCTSCWNFLAKKLILFNKPKPISEPIIEENSP